MNSQPEPDTYVDDGFFLDYDTLKSQYPDLSTVLPLFTNSKFSFFIHFFFIYVYRWPFDYNNERFRIHQTKTKPNNTKVKILLGNLFNIVSFNLIG